MKKLICLIMLVCNFVASYGQEEVLEPDAVRALQEANKTLSEENEQLKKLIYESATVKINGKTIETNGLLSGFSLAYTKYQNAKYKLYNKGNYVEIDGEDVLKYKDKTQELKNLNVTVKSANSTKAQEENTSKIKYLAILIFGCFLSLVAQTFGCDYILIRRMSRDSSELIDTIFKVVNTLTKRNDSTEEQIKSLLNKIISKLDNDSDNGQWKIIEYLKLLSENQDTNFKLLKNIIIENNSSFIYSNIDGTNNLLRPETKYMLLSNNINTLKELTNTSEQKLKKLAFTDSMIENIKQYLEEIGANLSPESLNDLSLPEEKLTIDDINFSVRTKNALKVNNIKTLDQLLNCTESKLSKTRAFGHKSMSELKDRLADFGLKLKDE